VEARCANCNRRFYKGGRHRFCTPACRYQGQALAQATKYDRTHKRLRAQVAPRRGSHEDPRFTLRVYAQATKRRDRLARAASDFAIESLPASATQNPARAGFC
jgi:hypothetical protein